MSLFISVLVIACNVVNSISSTLTPSSAPRVTLTLRQSRAPTEIPNQPQTAETNTFTTAEGASPSIVQTPLTPAPLPSLALIVAQPRCQATTAETSVCLGLVHNPLSQPVQQVTVRVRLHVAGQVYEQITAVEQAFIPSGHSAPYRTLFHSNHQNAYLVDSQLISAEVVVDETQYIVLQIQDFRVQVIGERYEIAATLVNAEADSALAAVAVITLQDDEGRLAGYRVVPLQPVIRPGDRIAFRSEVIPQIPGAHLRSSLHVEALRAAS